MGSVLDSGMRFRIDSNKIILIALLIFALILRIYNINAPFLDHHSWRQTDTAAIARNFYLEDRNILYPRIDWRGIGPGYVETEFQLVPFIASLLYSILGVSEWVARLIPIMFSLCSVILIFYLAKLYYNKKVAIFSTIFFVISPLNIFFSRAFMPESAMLFFSIASIYFFSRFLEDESWKYFCLATISTAFAFLVKIPTLYLLLPLGYLAYTKYGLRGITNYKLHLFLVLSLTPAILWYYHAHVNLSKYASFGIWQFGRDKWGNLQIWLDENFYKVLLVNRLPWIVLTPIGFTLFILGVFLNSGKKERVFHVWLVAVILYFFVVARGNYIHDYYQLPIVPVASIFIGKCMSRIYEIEKNRVAALAIILISFIFSIAIAQPLYNINNNMYEAAKAIKAISNKDDLIVTGEGNPAILYYSERKGWKRPVEYLTIKDIEKWRKMGAKYFVTTQLGVLESKGLLNYFIKNDDYSVLGGRGFVIVDFTKTSEKKPREQIKNKVFVNYSNIVQLTSYEITKYESNIFVITYYWKCLKEMDRNYVIFVHFTDKNGKIVFQQDHKPLYGLYPTSNWKEGEIVKESYIVVVPENVKPGTYNIRIGLWYPPTGERLKVSPKKYDDGTNRAIIGNISIG